MRRLSIDIGGTFTDLFAYDDTTGEITVGKGPTTPTDPSFKGFRDVLELRRGNSDELWDFYHDVALAPVRRRDRLEVEERIDYTVKVLTSIHSSSLKTAPRNGSAIK